jgi:DNA-binding PadR family transcriptional regulator
MERNGYLVQEVTAKGDYYALTEDGRVWLEKGIRAYVKNHPSERDDIQYLDTVQPARRVTRRR